MPIDDRYTGLFRRLPMIASLMDCEGRFIDVSDAWVERVGYSRDEMLGRRPEDIATPESARVIREDHLPRFRRLGRLDHVSVDFITKRGETIEMLATTIAEHEDNGEFMCSLTVFTELSERNKLERRYLDLYQSTPAMLHTVDSQGRITTVSDYWLEKLGYEREDVIGRSVFDFLPKESAQELRGRTLAEIIDSIAGKNIPRNMITKQGEILDVVMSGRAERDPLTGQLNMLVASKDVTERNRAEAKLRAAYEEIARLKDELERERDYLREEVNVSMNFGQIIGDSPALVAMIKRIEAVADTPSSVLIVGETGTGKELVARAIHNRSGRAGGPLVKVNCASIPDELFESEFFGHVRGAFTGAHQDRIGRFQLADGGTIFLDEIGEIPLALQGKLLRVLQEKEFERVGEDTSRSVDVRVIAATNKDLKKAVQDGEFREDLYYRLGVFPVRVPPLRDRGRDVVMLAIHFLEQVCREFGRDVPIITQSQVDALLAYDWPGNVRELKNVIERAVILSQGNNLRLDLPGAATAEITVKEQPASEGEAATDMPLYITDAEMKERIRANMIAALEAANWRISGKAGAAALLGLKPSTLTDRMRALRISKPTAH